MSISKIAIILLHAFAGWALCAATIGIGMAVTSLNTALVVHAIAAPVFFARVSLVYFRRFNLTNPSQTAEIFTACVVGMDFFKISEVPEDLRDLGWIGSMDFFKISEVSEDLRDLGWIGFRGLI